MLHWMGRINLKDLNWKARPYSAWLAYGQSKLANLLFTSELQRRLDAAGSPLQGASPPIPATRRPTCRATPAAGRRRVDDDRQPAIATDADFGARQTLYAASQDLPGDTFIGPRFGHVRPHPARRRAARWPATPRRPLRCGSCPSSSRTPNSDSDLGLSSSSGYPGCQSRRGWSGHRYRREPISEVAPWPCSNNTTQEQNPMAKNAPNNLTAAVRKETGKGASRRARRNGKVPAVLYGHGSDPQHLELNAHDFAAVLRHAGTNAVLTLDIEGTEQLALTKALDIHPIRRSIQHADLLVVRRGEKVTVEVNVVVEGEADPRHAGHPGRQHHRDRSRRAVDPRTPHRVGRGRRRSAPSSPPARSRCLRVSRWCPTPTRSWSTSSPPRPPRRSRPRAPARPPR